MSSAVRPPDGPGVLLYRCRRCEHLQTEPVGSVQASVMVAAGGGTAVQLTGWHLCGDGAVGITDLIGGLPDVEQEGSKS